jgi:Protein of unknown function (DUF3108)
MHYQFAKFASPSLLLAAFALTAAPVNAPGFNNEQLRYTINWSSGLSLGEANLHATLLKPTQDTERRHLEFDLDAAVPGYAVSDRYRSDSSSDFCSTEFQRTTTHGRKKTDEKTTFDAHSGTATRQTVGGGKSDLKLPTCGKDALTYLYFVRRELSQGRIPPPQTIFFGPSYEARVEFAGTQKIRVGDTQVDADRLTASVKGTSTDSSISFEVFFLKDAARTPALVRVPLSLGTFSMELVK